MKILTFVATLVVNFFVIVEAAEESFVTINLRNSVNEISDKFISYEIDFYKLMEAVTDRQPFTILSPSYVKLGNFIKFLRDDSTDGQVRDVISIFQSFDRNKITPVIVVDYNSTNFEPLVLLEDMKTANELGIQECVWQLGKPESLLDSISIKKYSDDLKTLKILCESVKRGSKSNWRIAAVAAQAASSDNNIPTVVAGLDVGELSDIISTSLEKKAITSNSAVWATIKSIDLSSASARINHNRKGQGACDENCLLDGLLYAQVLGDYAKKGFDVLFFDNNAASSHPFYESSFKRAINKVHNALIGTKVFNVRKAASGEKQLSMYAYCSKRMNGGVTLIGINYSNTRAKINSKLLSSNEKNSVVSQYLLSVADGYVMLNNERYNGTLKAAHKFKKISNHNVDLTIPPYSIVFWVVKNANAKECINVEANHVRPMTSASSISPSSSSSSSSDKLLKTLVANAIIEKEKSGRVKRQFGALPRLDFKFANLMPSNINQRSIKDVLFNRNTEIYKVAPAIDQNPLESRENPLLPSGDIYLLINDGKDDYVDAQIDIPKFQRKSSLKSKFRPVSKVRDDSANEASEAHEIFLPHDYEERTTPNKKSQVKKASKPQQQQQPQEVGELFEKEIFSNAYESNDQQMKGSSKNIEIKTVTRELEPTIRQSKKAILAAKKKFSHGQLMELLKDANLEEINRSHFNNAGDYEVIDLTDIKGDELPDYAEEYDDDEDGFFGDNTKVRTKRAAIDYSKNEIPRDDNYVDEDEDFSIENLSNFHLFMPHLESTDNSKSIKLTTSPSTSTTTTEAPNNMDSLGIKIIDVFSKSVDDVVHVVHNNLRSIFNVFTSPSTQYY